MRLYLDEDAMADALVAALRGQGFDVETAHNPGTADGVMRITSSTRLIRPECCISFNRGDYRRIHTRWMSDGRRHAGIVLLSRRTYDIGYQLRGLMDVAGRPGQDGMRDQVEFI